MGKAGTRWSSLLFNKWITGLYPSGNLSVIINMMHGRSHHLTAVLTGMGPFDRLSNKYPIDRTSRGEKRRDSFGPTLRSLYLL